MSLDIWLSGNVDAGNVEPHTVCLHDAGITHNVGRMAKRARFYDALWNFKGGDAGSLIEPLTEGLATLKANPVTMRHHEPANGWGTYDGLVSFTEALLAACIKFPKARVEVSV